MEARHRGPRGHGLEQFSPRTLREMSSKAVLRENRRDQRHDMLSQKEKVLRTGHIERG